MNLRNIIIAALLIGTPLLIVYILSAEDIKSTTKKQPLAQIAKAIPGLKAPTSDVNQILKTKRCKGCDLREIDLSDLDLSGADFRNADLSGANLANTKLKDAQSKLPVQDVEIFPIEK